MPAWLQTCTGRPFVFDAPVVDTEHLTSEVAPVLAAVPRFGGHTLWHYTVAQHSVLCAEAAEDLHGDLELAAFCLLHDAHETWTGDITRPLQAALFDALGMSGPIDTKALGKIQKRIDRAVFTAAGLDPKRYDHHAPRVKEIDVRALRTERDLLMHIPPMPWDSPIEEAPPLPIRDDGLLLRCSPSAAELAFMAALCRLCPALQNAAD